MKRRLQYSLYALLALTAIAWIADGVIVHFRADQFATIRVDQVYAITNRWNNVDYSIGDPKNQRCVNALFPHSGSAPCWYVKSHTLTYVRGGN